MALPPKPPPEAWAITVYFTPGSDHAGHQAVQARRLARGLLRRADRARQVELVHLAQVVSPTGTVETVEPDYDPPPDA